MAFAGFDSLDYPGDDMMQWLKSNTNLSFVGFYLAPAPSRPTSDWMDRYSELAAQGWGFAPVYVGQQEVGQPGSHNLTGEQGTLDGRDATELMFKAGFPPNSIVYLDCEQGGPASDATLEYVGAWVDAVRLSVNTYTPGIYCSYTTAASLLAIRPDVCVWVWHITKPADPPTFPTPDPAASGCPQATVWQYYQNEKITFGGSPNPDLKLDLDSATTADPSKVGIAMALVEVSATTDHALPDVEMSATADPSKVGIAMPEVERSATPRKKRTAKKSGAKRRRTAKAPPRKSSAKKRSKAKTKKVSERKKSGRKKKKAKSARKR